VRFTHPSREDAKRYSQPQFVATLKVVFLLRTIVFCWKKLCSGDYIEHLTLRTNILNLCKSFKIWAT